VWASSERTLVLLRRTHTHSRPQATTCSRLFLVHSISYRLSTKPLPPGRAAAAPDMAGPELWTPLTMGSDRNALPSVDYPIGLWSSSCMKRNGRLIDKPLKEFLSLQIRQKSFFLNQKSLISDFLPTIGDQMSKSHKHKSNSRHGSG